MVSLMDLDDIEKVRLIAKQRIAAHELTATALALKVGVKQPSMSNFLSGRRSFRKQTMELLFDALHLSREQLRPPLPAITLTKGLLIPLVKQMTAIVQPQINPNMVVDVIRVKISAPRQIVSDELNLRLAWTRFVAINLTRAQVRFMSPLFSEKTTVVLDRHDQRIGGSYRRRPTISAVTDGELLGIGYLKWVGGQLQLHPHANGPHPQLIKIGPGPPRTHQIVGRVCKMLRDT
jgi:hypothetical protein